jgi:rhodanese-related sulfurtransferase
MADQVDAQTLKSWLSDGAEIALIDVREAGQFGEAHPFFAVPLPYSRFGPSLWRLVPNPAVRLVLCDEGDGVAERAAKRAQVLGYRNIHILRGGAPAWGRAGYTLYAGVNVPSKTFGELVEQRRHTPHIGALELQAMREAGADMVIVDGRTFAEYQRMNIPDGISCPNGELALRIADIAPDPNTTIVVNCAGRTRSIIGAQTLIDFGVPNPVIALENGTQGWFLAGLELEHGASRRYPDAAGSRDGTALAARARALAQRHGVGFVTAAQADEWWHDRTRTTYFFDIRLEGEWKLAPDWAYFFQNRLAGEWPLLQGFVHAPGGQLIQATDQWVGVKGARLVLGDEELVRAPVVASWLRQLGHEAYVLEGGLPKVTPLPVQSGSDLISELNLKAPEGAPEARIISPRELADALSAGTAQVIDVRPSMTYRKGHIPQAIWSIRPRITTVADRRKDVVIIDDHVMLGGFAWVELFDAGFPFEKLVMLAGGFEAWCAAGLPVEATPNLPPDKDCIDFLFFTARRHDNDREAARQYLAWETGLLAQLDEQERGVFRIP